MSEAEMEMLGFTPEDFDPIEIWPDNELSFNVFVVISTQWRVGAGGATGLDYCVLPEIWQRNSR